MSPFPGMDDVAGNGDGIATGLALYSADKGMEESPWFRSIEKSSLPQQGRELGYVGYATPED